MKRKKGLIVAIVLIVGVLAASGMYVMSRAKESQISEQMLVGDRYLEELDYDKAIAAFQAVLEIEPKNVEAHKGIVNAYVSKGEPEKAYEYIWSVYDELEDEEILVELVSALGDEYVEEFDLDRSIAVYESILESDPDNMEAHKGIINVYTSKGEYQKAFEYAKDLYTKNPSEELLYLLILVEYKSGTQLGVVDVLKKEAAISGGVPKILEELIPMIMQVFGEENANFLLVDFVGWINEAEFKEVMGMLSAEQSEKLRGVLETFGTLSGGGFNSSEYMWSFYIESQYNVFIYYSKERLEIIVTSFEDGNIERCIWYW